MVLAPQSAAERAYAKAAGTTRTTAPDTQTPPPSEAAAVPALASGFQPRPDINLTNHGGHTITDLTAIGRYLGGAAKWNDTDRTNIDHAITALLTDPGMQDIIGQYFPGTPITLSFPPFDGHLP